MLLGRIVTTATATNSGHVRIYAWNSATSAWEQQGADIDGEAAGDYSGRSVSLSSDGTTVAIGAYGNDGNGDNSGHVRIYAWNSTTSAWEQQGADIDGEAEYDESGRSVSLSSDGTTVAIGAYRNDGNGSNSGHVRIYAWNSATSAWEQQGADIDGEAAGDYSGESVSLSSDGTTVAIGANSNDGNGENSGQVRIYAWNSATSAWDQQGADIDGEAAGDRSGESVSLSSDGTTVAIGAHQNDGNGNLSGHVRIYAWNSATSAWDQQGADIDGEAAGDVSGSSVSLSSDGTTVAIGALTNDGNGTDSGHVRIYAWNSAASAWEQQGADIDGEAAGDYSGIAFPFPPTARPLLLGRRITTATAPPPVTCGCTLFRVLRLLKAALMRTGRTIILKRMSTTARVSYTAVPLQMLVTIIRKQQVMTALVFSIAPDVRMR